jgi:hypothetical protein
MTNKVYRTAQGKVVDLGALFLQNENVRAVGNMKVNARGDKLDASGKPIMPRNQQVARSYDRGTNTSKSPVVSSSKVVHEVSQAAIEKEKQEKAKAQRQARREAMAQGKEVETNRGDAPLSGLAAAMSRANQINDNE